MLLAAGGIVHPGQRQCMRELFGHNHGFALAALREIFQKGPSDTRSLDPRTRPSCGFTRAEAGEHSEYQCRKQGCYERTERHRRQQ